MKHLDYIFLQGKGKFIRVMHPDLEYRCWSVVLYLNQASYDEFMKLKEGDDQTLGILNEVKKDEDGYFVRLKRPMEKEFMGKTTQLTPPLVQNKDGTPYIGQGIGDGSDLTCKVEFYKYKPRMGKGTKKGSAIRLYAVTIDNLVPFTKEFYSDDQLRQAKGLSDQPPQKEMW